MILSWFSKIILIFSMSLKKLFFFVCFLYFDIKTMYHRFLSRYITWIPPCRSIDKFKTRTIPTTKVLFLKNSKFFITRSLSTYSNRLMSQQHRVEDIQKFYRYFSEAQQSQNQEAPQTVEETAKEEEKPVESNEKDSKKDKKEKNSKPVCLNWHFLLQICF